MKYQFIFDHRGTFKVGRVCKLINVSRASYYAWLKRPESHRSRANRCLEDKIRVLHRTSHGIYGSPRIHRDLVQDGVQCGKNRVARIMREAGIRSRTKRKFKATTNSKHNLPVAPNLLNQDFTARAQDCAWVGDICVLQQRRVSMLAALREKLHERWRNRPSEVCLQGPASNHP